MRARARDAGREPRVKQSGGWSRIGRAIRLTGARSPLRIFKALSSSKWSPSEAPRFRGVPGQLRTSRTSNSRGEGNRARGGE